MRSAPHVPTDHMTLGSRRMIAWSRKRSIMRSYSCSFSVGCIVIRYERLQCVCRNKPLGSDCARSWHRELNTSGFGVGRHSGTVGEQVIANRRGHSPAPRKSGFVSDWTVFRIAGEEPSHGKVISDKKSGRIVAPISYESSAMLLPVLFRNDAIEFLEAREFSVIDRSDHVTPLYGSGIGGRINAPHYRPKLTPSALRSAGGTLNARPSGVSPNVPVG